MSFRPTTASSRGFPPRECNTGLRQHPWYLWVSSRPEPQQSIGLCRIESRTALLITGHETYTLTQKPDSNGVASVHAMKPTPRRGQRASAQLVDVGLVLRYAGTTFCTEPSVIKRSTPGGTLAIIRSVRGVLRLLSQRLIDPEFAVSHQSVPGPSATSVAPSGQAERGQPTGAHRSGRPPRMGLTHRGPAHSHVRIAGFTRQT
jgi:hypothetical protein